MDTIKTFIEDRPAVVRWSMLGAVAVVPVLIAFNSLSGVDEPANVDRPRWGEVKRVVSGHKVKLDSGEYLIYAGIRAPYPHEPFHGRARRRNLELVEGKEVRLRFDEVERDKKGRLLAYVSVDGVMVNELLVREGLAYVRLTPDVVRFADMLLAAQSEARQAGRGVWRDMSRSSVVGVRGDPKYGNFHHPSCEEFDKINPSRLIIFDTKSDALEAGLAPCSKCLP